MIKDVIMHYSGGESLLTIIPKDLVSGIAFHQTPKLHSIHFTRLIDA